MKNLLAYFSKKTCLLISVKNLLAYFGKKLACLFQ